MLFGGIVKSETDSNASEAPAGNGEGARLNRHLSPLHVWSLAFGCIIGWGAFMMPGTTFLPTAGTLGTTVAMLVGALVMVVISLSYSYMVSRHPKVGGEFVFARACFGRRHAFVCGWFLALAYLANVPMNCTALGLMTRKLFFGVFQFGRLGQVAGYDIWAGEIMLSLVTLSVVSVLSVRGVRKSGVFQTIMAFGLATAFAIIVVSAVFSPVTSWSNLAPLWGPEAGGAAPGGLQALRGVLAIVAVAPWAYVGFETIPQAVEEFSFSIRKVNGIMVGAIAFGCAVYSCNNLVTAAASPDWQDFIARHDWAVGAAVEALMGKPGLVVLGIAISCAILTGILGFLTATSRLLMSMAREGYIPKFFGEVSPRWRTPARAIVFCFALSAVGPFFGRTALGWFVDMSAVGAAAGFAYACASALKTARGEAGRAGSAAMTALSALGLVLSLCFVALLVVPGLPGCLTGQGYAMLGAWIAMGAVFYAMRARKIR